MKKKICAALALLMVLAMFSGCAKKVSLFDFLGEEYSSFYSSFDTVPPVMISVRTDNEEEVAFKHSYDTGVIKAYFNALKNITVGGVSKEKPDDIDVSYIFTMEDDSQVVFTFNDGKLFYGDKYYKTTAYALLSETPIIGDEPYDQYMIVAGASLSEDGEIAQIFASYAYYTQTNHGYYINWDYEQITSLLLDPNAVIIGIDMKDATKDKNLTLKQFCDVIGTYYEVLGNDCVFLAHIEDGSVKSLKFFRFDDYDYSAVAFGSIDKARLIDVIVNDFYAQDGSLIATGSAENSGTEGIMGVNILVSFYDEQGLELAQSRFVKGFDEPLMPGEYIDWSVKCENVENAKSVTNIDADISENLGE